MSLSDDLLKRVADAVAENRPATADDLLARFKSEFTLRPGFQGYANPRVTALIDTMSNTEVTHLKFIPMRDDGYVVMMPALSTEDGAVELTRGLSRRTGMVNLRVALNPFGLELADERKLKIPVISAEVAGEGAKRQVLPLRIKRPVTKKTEARPRKNKKEPAKPTEETA